MPSRRHMLTLAGSIGAATLAGCSGNGDSEEPSPEIEADPEAPARLEILRLTRPDEIVFGDEFEAEITIGNTGGEPIEENGFIELVGVGFDSTQDAEINASELASGEIRTHTIGPFDAVSAGELRLNAGAQVAGIRDDVEELISIQPQEVEIGEQIETLDNLRLTVTDVGYEQALIHADGAEDTDQEVTIRTTLDDRIVVVPQITIENADSDPATVSSDTFVVENGSAISGFDPYGLSGRDLRGVQVNPGEQIQGVIMSAIDMADVGTSAIGFSFVGDTVDVRVPFESDPQFPRFEQVSGAVPSPRQEGAEEYRFEVQNTGDATGTFRGVLEYRFEEDPGIFSSYTDGVYYSDFFEVATVEIPPGETQTVSFVTDSDTEIDVTYRLQPFGSEYLVSGL